MKASNKKSVILIIICWLVYVSTYICKLGYTANIISIEEYFNITHEDAGIVSTLFFFSYGLFQIINGILSKKYNIKYMVFISLIVSSLCNLGLAFLSNFNLIKVLWFINGAFLSCLWPLIIRLLSMTLDDKECNKAIVVMGTTTATGTLLVYGLSALFTELGNFKIIFYFASILIPIIAVIWLISYNSLTKEKHETEKDEEIQTNTNFERKTLVLLILSFSVFAISSYLIKDGVTTWIPAILKETYGMPDSLSILFTLFLPFCSLFGTAFVVFMNKRIKKYSLLFSFLYVILIIIFTTTYSFFKSSVVLLIISLALVSLIGTSLNSLVTTVIPLEWRDKVDSGKMSGIMNGLCYIGSMISSYGLGYIADKDGWSMVFIILGMVSIFCLFASFISLVIENKFKKI